MVLEAAVHTHVTIDVQRRSGGRLQERGQRDRSDTAGELVRRVHRSSAEQFAVVDADVARCEYTKRLMTRVLALHRIDHHDDELRVTHTAGSLTARHVVIALAPSIAVGTIEFRPTLPEQLVSLAASTPVWMGNIVKVVAVYRHAFWRQSGLSGAAVSHIGPLREIHDMSGADFDPAALFGFAPLGPDAPTPTRQSIVDQLTEIFGPEAASPLEIVIKDWRPDALGGPSGTRQRTPMETYGHRLYQQPAGDNGHIHWASTETASRSPGHIEGAIAAAERAVAAITRNPSQQ